MLHLVRSVTIQPLVMLALWVLLSPAARAQEIPAELQPWVGWVLEGHPALRCPVTADGAACVWPGELVLDLGAHGGDFELAVRTDREIAVPLPGGPARWPQGVVADGQPAVVLDNGGVPMVLLPEGEHRVQGRFAWATTPQGLPLPTTTGRVRLTLDGRAVAQPAIDDEGLLRLGPGGSAPAAEERLDLEVSRHVVDGVPVRIETRITLRASGSAREVTLGAVGLSDTRPVSLTADLPARFTADGALVVQVRAGTFTARIESLHEGPLTSLAAPALPEPWPAQEFWAVTTDDQVRAVELSGPPAVDPARTPLPEEWRGLATYMVSAQTPLAFGELRRGEPEPAPNRLSLDREIWLDADGGGYTFRDRFDGSMTQGWGMGMLPPYELGHAVEGGRDLVITRDEGDHPGVALRSSSLHLVAESRVEGRPAELPIVGWATDVASLQATLHLAPGWRLLAATGVDRVPGSLLHDWDLFDLFYVLILALATGRLLGWKWAGVALVGLALSRQHGDAPSWAWVFLLVSVGLHRWVPAGWPRHVALGLRWCLGALLLIILIPFAVDQVRTGLFPVLEHPWQSSVPDQGVFTGAPPQGGEMDRLSVADEEATWAEEVTVRKVQQQQDYDQRGSSSLDIGGLLASESGLSRGSAGKKGKLDDSRYLSLQYDPTSVATTGPGVQQWNWNPNANELYEWEGLPTFGGDPVLEWSGPVSSDHSVRLFLLGPRANGALNMLRVILLLALGLRMAGLESLRLPRGAAAGVGAAVLGVLLLSPAAMATPDAALLQQLEQRLTQAPACGDACVTTPDLVFSVQGGRLVMEAEVHAAALGSWAVPGPSRAWVPASVEVDGAPTTALARLRDGFLHVRLEPGVHRVRAVGPLPAADSVTITLGQAPKRAGWLAHDDWNLDGLHPDGTAEHTVQLTRTLPSAAGEGEAADADNLTPWLEVRRTLDLGIPWRVRTEVERVGGSDAALSLQVPVLEGEAVTDETLQVEAGMVRVSLDRSRPSVSWVSTLEERDTIALTAPEGVPWTERWSMSCSPVFDCQASGIDPLEHTQAGTWSPRWSPWPGERVDIAVRRPDAVPGQTVTIDQARLDWTPGRRLGEGSLGMVLRTSQGGQQAVTLPPGAKLQQVSIDGRQRPLQLRDGKVWLPLQPGAQSVLLSWQQPHEPTLIDRVPSVDLGSTAVNVGVVMHAPAERCILAVTGPGWGPVPLFWTYVLVVLVAAPLLARLPWTPLRTWQWLLLGLGMTQVPILCPAVVVGWFVLVGFRRQRAPKAWWAFDLTQLGVIFATLVAMVCLYAAIHAGLLLQPDMQIEGNGSSATELMWFADRIDGALPTPAVLSIPMWSWRVAMLLWALWLAASLLKWLPWTWASFRKDRWYAMPPTPAPVRAKAGGAPPSTREPEPAKAEPAPPAAEPELPTPEAEPPPMPADPTEAP
jgi:hypothetical protein